MAHAGEELAEAIAHAEHVLTVLTPHYESVGIAFRVHLLGLGHMTQYARDDLEVAQRVALALTTPTETAQDPVLKSPLVPRFTTRKAAFVLTCRGQGA